MSVATNKIDKINIRINSKDKKSLEKAAELNHPRSCWMMGQSYQYGWGVPVSQTDAVFWYRKGTELNNEDSQISLADLLFESKKKDDWKESVNWYGLVAERGNQNALKAKNQLGRCYLYGKGIEYNLDKAMELFEFCGEQGYAGGWFMLGEMYAKRMGVEIDLPLALEYYQKAIDLGHPEAQTQYDYYKALIK